MYNTIALSGSLPGTTCGALTFAPPSIQNGDPDGIALVDADDNVLEFISYGGSFTAVGGPADGMASVEIGVSETCLLYTSPSPRDRTRSRMPSSA